MPNKAFGYLEGKILLSEDNARTWPHSAAFPDAKKITFSHILKNGNILFATGANLYLSTDNLKSYKPITVKDAKGRDYLPHTPKNPENPGWYFHTLPGIVSWDIGGKEIMVWGNYCNVIGGATPVNIYYSTDSGQTVKLAYTFGCNPNFSDTGSGGGGKGGNLLGDPDNPIIARHLHGVSYNPVENAFYACTGDGDRPEGKECHWLRGTYDAANDQWQWKVIVTASLNTRYKCGGISFVDGKCYWISDANGPKPHDRGIFCCDPADIPNPEKHTMLFNPGVESGNMIIQDGVMLASHCAGLAHEERNHRFHRHGQDLGPVRPGGVRSEIGNPFPREEQRRVVPPRPADRLGDAGRRDVHQAQAGSRGAKQLIAPKGRPQH